MAIRCFKNLKKTVSISFNSVNTEIGNYLLSYKNDINVTAQINLNIYNNKKRLQLNIKDVFI